MSIEDTHSNGIDIVLYRFVTGAEFCDALIDGVHVREDQVGVGREWRFAGFFNRWRWRWRTIDCLHIDVSTLDGRWGCSEDGGVESRFFDFHANGTRDHRGNLVVFD